MESAESPNKKSLEDGPIFNAKNLKRVVQFLSFVFVMFCLAVFSEYLDDNPIIWHITLGILLAKVIQTAFVAALALLSEFVN